MEGVGGGESWRANCHTEVNKGLPTEPIGLVVCLQPHMCSVHRLDPSGGCENENIKVFEGNSTKGPLLGRVCSKHDYIPVFESSSDTLTIQIVTDSVRMERTVFIFYYYFSPGTCKFSCVHTLHLRAQRATYSPAWVVVALSLDLCPESSLCVRAVVL